MVAISGSTLTALTLASTAIGVIGSLKAGADASKAARFQQAVALQNAGRERELAQLAADDKRREGSRLAATQRARLAGAGVDPSTGTALLLQEDLAAETEFQALRIKTAGLTEAAALESEASLFGQRASAARSAGTFSAGTTLLRGGIKAFGKPTGKK